MSRPQFDDLSLAWLRAKPGKKWAEVAPDVLPAWVADMDFRPPEPVLSAIHAAVNRGDLGYPSDQDTLEEPFRARMSTRFAWQPRPGRTRDFTDVVNGLEAVLSAVVKRGDVVVCHAPTYPPFLDAFRRLGLTLRTIPFERTFRGWRFDPERARAAIDGAKVVLVVNPHNPTGRVMGRAELEVIAEAALAAGAVVVSDEVHADLTYPGRTHIPFASLGEEVAAATVTLTSATKTFNLAGIRCAVGHIGDDRVWQRLQAAPEHIFGVVGNLGRVATRAAWETGDAWREALIRHLDGNRRRVTERMANDLPMVRYTPPEATYLAWLDLRRTGLGPDPAQALLERARVRLTPGHDFGPEGTGFARLNFATSGPILDAVLIRLQRAIEETSHADHR